VKEEPIAESVGTAVECNHAKLIKTWSLASVTFGGEDTTSRFLGEPYSYEDGNVEEGMIEGCSNANSESFSISAFGLYSIVWLGVVKELLLKLINGIGSVLITLLFIQEFQRMEK